MELRDDKLNLDLDGIAANQMLKSRWAYLAIAVFTLAVQVAAAAHLPALHEEPVSKSRDNGAHFCAEIISRKPAPASSATSA